MNIEKNHLRIGQLAQQVGVEQFVIRFWEREFKIKARRSPGGQRFYTQEDVEEFQKIKKLLYEEKFTIDGARAVLKGGSADSVLLSRRAQEHESVCTHGDLLKEISELKAALIRLRSML